MKNRKKYVKGREVLSDLLLLSGAGLLSTGAGLIYFPAGLMVGGFCAVLLSVLLGMGGGGHDSERTV